MIASFCSRVVLAELAPSSVISVNKREVTARMEAVSAVWWCSLPCRQQGQRRRLTRRPGDARRPRRHLDPAVSRAVPLALALALLAASTPTTAVASDSGDGASTASTAAAGHAAPVGGGSDGGAAEASDHGHRYKNSGDKADSDSCPWNSEGQTCGDAPTLFRLEGEKVGHTQDIELVPGKVHQLRTINMKPVIFEIADFFTDDECGRVIGMALEQGLEKSHTTSGEESGALALRDLNGDGRLSPREMQLTLEDGYDTFLDDGDVNKMYADLGVDLNNDGYLSREEVGGKVIRQISSYIQKLRRENPVKKSRFSEQTWIYPDRVEDPLVASFQSRLSKLTQLPQPLIDKFSYFQVVRYGKHGHYNAHHDSSYLDDKVCCHLTASKTCRICRFMTIMVYLNDVEEGGETAFPVANNDTYSTHAFRQTGKMNLNARCGESNLKVRPRRGKAVLWYNHFVNASTGWLGEIDPLTWHGGCAVTKGHKWIMNRWIAVSNSPAVDLALP